MRRFLISTVILSVCYLGIGYVFDRNLLVSHAKWSFSPEQEISSVKEAVREYNRIFSDLYASNGVTTRLDDFPASIQLRHELYRNLGALRQKNLVLVYDMATLVFVDVQITSPETAEVTTHEEWNYVYQEALTRETAEPIKGMSQGFTYSMVKRNGKWSVMSYIPADVEIQKEDGFYF